MNDSFLEDLDLIPKRGSTLQKKSEVNRNITTRKVLSPPSNIRSKSDFENIENRPDKIISSSTSNISKVKVSSRRSGSQEPRRSSGPDTKPLSSTPKSDKKILGDEKVIKLVENQISSRRSDEIYIKPQNIKAVSKIHDSKTLKESRRSGGSSSSRYLDASSKENTRPSIESCSSRESGSQADLRKEINRRISDGATKKSDILEKTDPVMLLSAIKDLISRYTEQETVKVLRAMQNLHINSQANLIKQQMLQTNELVKELNLHKNFGSVKALMEENERMREDIFMLRARNEVLQKKVDEMALIREENISLKLKLQELQQ